MPVSRASRPTANVEALNTGSIAELMGTVVVPAVTDTLPLPSNAMNLLARVALLGSTMLVLVGSLRGPRIALAISCSRSPTCIVMVSKSASRLAAVMLPPAV